MILETNLIIFLIFVTFLGSTVKTTTGFGFALISVPLLLPFMDLPNIVAIILPLVLINDYAITITHKNTLKPTEIGNHFTTASKVSLSNLGLIVGFAKPSHLPGMKRREWYNTRTNDKGAFEHVVFPVNERSIYELYINGGEKKKGFKSIKKLKKGQKLIIDQTVGERKKVKGTILAPDGIGKQFGIVVQVVGLDENGNETDYTQSRYSDKEGGFEFNNLPERNFHIRLHGKGDFIYFLDKNNKKRILNLGKKGQSYEQLKIRIPTLAKGTWDKMGYIDGVLSDYSPSNFIDEENNIWIGTWTGLTKYDGQETFSLNSDNGLPKYPIWDVIQDKNNNIWLSSGDNASGEGGLVLLKDNQIKKVYTKSDGLGGDNCGKLSQSLNGDILIGGNGGFQIYNGESFEVYNYTDGLANGFVRAYFVRLVR